MSEDLEYNMIAAQVELVRETQSKLKDIGVNGSYFTFLEVDDPASLGLHLPFYHMEELFEYFGLEWFGAPAGESVEDDKARAKALLPHIREIGIPDAQAVHHPLGEQQCHGIFIPWNKTPVLGEHVGRHILSGILDGTIEIEKDETV